MRLAFLLSLSVALFVTAVMGDLETDTFTADPNHPAIHYGNATGNDAVAQMNVQVALDVVQLKFDDKQGYLRAVLDALHIPVESQMMVFSKTSFQQASITPQNPRSIYFNDSVAVGWVHGGPIVELAAEDPTQGMVFYTLDEKQTEHPRFIRQDSCLACHVAYSTMSVPGTIVRSVIVGQTGDPLRGLGDYLTDDRSPFAERWGGWYVTGNTGSVRHIGNVMGSTVAATAPSAGASEMSSLVGKFNTDAYISPYSDVVALMVFEHEMHVMNLFTRVGWEVRLAKYTEQTKPSEANRDAIAQTVQKTSSELADYLLFADEVPLASKIRGTSGFAERFSAEGPRDARGRSLHQLDLNHRLMKYPCSYMIYSDAFDQLPAEAKSATYQRMWEILSGADKSPKYAKLSRADRKNIVGILRGTKKDLPEYFSGALR
jgi:hypothetical protein